MTEPVYRWQPVTDVYKEQASQSASAEAENQQKLRELHESDLRKPWTQGKAPLGIRILTWYFFVRGGVCLLLLLVLASFPASGPSAWLFDNIGNFVHSPSRQPSLDARQQEFEREAQANGFQSSGDSPGENIPGLITPEVMRNIVMVYLFVNAVVSPIVGFMWWNRSWKVRWVTMFYSGAIVGKAAINYLAGAASGVGSQIDPRQAPLLLMALALNGLIFLYLAFGIGVKQWFEPMS
jgi:hypothetical protein